MPTAAPQIQQAGIQESGLSYSFLGTKGKRPKARTVLVTKKILNKIMGY